MDSSVSIFGYEKCFYALQCAAGITTFLMVRIIPDFQIAYEAVHVDVVEEDKVPHSDIVV